MSNLPSTGSVNEIAFAAGITVMAALKKAAVEVIFFNMRGQYDYYFKKRLSLTGSQL
ncbi:hypothetical protein [Photobacterium rosenbergii]|uniref:Uncharacterized protein n=1 Tax=Photobacterium rosenbergii TaxID=294936 RepID=A0ABU3ZF21_9GAMM|nr:hypothetical protein [Photobacterium rosenbergii]MDV5168534.1 hypothetical protein [Photobacterium rosenbergii]